MIGCFGLILNELESRADAAEKCIVACGWEKAKSKVAWLFIAAAGLALLTLVAEHAPTVARTLAECRKLKTH